MKSTFEKLWGKIEGNMSKGTYILDIQNDIKFEVFQVEKSFVLREVNFLGGENPWFFISFFILFFILLIVTLGLLYARNVENREKLKLK